MKKEKESKEAARVTITRKIELVLHCEDEQLRKDQFKQLLEWKYQVFRAANMVINHQHFTYLLRRKIKDTVSENEKQGWKEAKQMVETLYDTSLLNDTYRMVSEEFPDLPSSIRTCINMQVAQKYNNDLKEVLRGERTIANYKYGMPIPFAISAKDNLERIPTEHGEDIILKFFKGIKFRLNFGRDKSNNQVMIDRAIAGEYKLCNSSIILEKKQNKYSIYLLAVIQHDRLKTSLDYDKVAATNLGMNCPIFLTTSEGHEMPIGSKDEFLRVRLQFQARRRKLQKDLDMAKAGHGRERKLKALEHLKKVEANYANTYNHKLSKKIVMFCYNNGIGTIKTENLLGGAETLEKTFVLRNWSYFQLQADLEYKAAMYNIKVIKVAPQYITRKCNCCGNIAEEAVNLQDRTYICVNDACKLFGVKVDIDKNASLNVLDTEESKVEKTELIEVV